MLWRRKKTLHEKMLEQAGLAEAVDLPRVGAPGSARVEVSEDTAQFVRERGGRVYVWVSDSGFVSTSTEPPARDTEWIRHEGGGVELFQDAAIVTPELWKVIRNPLSRRVQALYDGDHGYADGGA